MSGIETSICRATPADAHSLSDLSAAVFPLGCPANTKLEDLADYIARELTPNRFRALLEAEENVILLANVSDQLAGYALVAPAPPPSHAPIHAQWELRKFYIQPAWHGRGVANSLMQAVIASAEDRQDGALWLSVFSENQRAISFYKRWGFRIVGSQNFLVGTDSQRDYLMLLEGRAAGKLSHPGR